MISPIRVDEKYICAQMSEAQRTQALRFEIGKRLTVLGHCECPELASRARAWC
jgi:hypothetical protein